MANAQTSSSLIVPVVLWGKKPPKNRISCVRPLPDGKTIITGSLDGEIVVWNITSDGRIVPRMMLVGQESKINCISPTGVTGKSTRFVSASSDRLLSLWDSVDGRNIDSIISNYVHLQITPHRSRFGPHGRGRNALYCIGEYSEIVVIDPQDLNVIFTLNSRVEPDWISAIAFIQPTTTTDSVVGVSVSGMMKVWKLVDMDKKDFPTVLYEEESKTVSASLANTISWDISNQSSILVVAVNSWQIFDLVDMNQLITMKSQEPLCGGSVIGQTRVAISTSSGYIQLFYVPESAFDVSYSSDGAAKPKKTPYIYAMLLGTSSDFAWPPRMVYSFSKVENSATAKRPDDNISSANTWTAYRASIDGDLCVWNIPEIGLKQVEKCASKPMVFKPTIQTSLADVWKSLDELPHNIFETQDDCPITATLYIGAQGRLVLGLKDGTILIMYACEAITKQLLQSDSADVSCRRLNEHKAAVTCMLYPHEEHSRYDAQLLISGSADFSVIVWNINTGSRIHRFCVQGGPVLRLFVPPPTCNARILHTVCSVAGDNSAALLSLKENKCLLLASRQSFPIVDVRWRPADDFLLLKCEDDTVYVWQIDTTSLERVVKGIVSEEILLGCEEQIRGEESNEDSGASQAVQMIRAVRYRNIDAIRKIAMGERDKIADLTECETELPSPMSVAPLNRTADAPHVVFFNVDSLIIGLLSTNKAVSLTDGSTEYKSLSTILQGKQAGNNNNRHVSQKMMFPSETNLYMDVVTLCLSLLHAWTMDENLDDVCVRKLRMSKPSVPLSFGLVSRQGSLSLMLPCAMPHVSQGSNAEMCKNKFDIFASYVHWSISSSLTTTHLLAVIAVANTLISLRGLLFDASKRKSLTRRSSMRSSSSDVSESESKVKQGWSLLAALHCYLLPGHMKTRGAYCAPRIELLARRWQDRFLEVRMAAQALLKYELKRLGPTGRKTLTENWALFLPTSLDPTLSIFGQRAVTATICGAVVPSSVATTHPAPSSQPPPIPPRGKTIPLPDVFIQEDLTYEYTTGIQQVRRNQATAIILLGVVAAEFPDEMNKMELSRDTALCLLELLVSPSTDVLPLVSPLRRAAIDLIGRGFAVYQPHLDISKVLLGLLDLASSNEKFSGDYGPILPPAVDACRTARNALSLIATSRPPALITALSKEVARYNSAAQHQTIQHTVISPLLKSRNEVLYLIEVLASRQYSDVADLIIPVGEILVHCLDTSLLKHKTLAEIFPPITGFYMVAYCASTRRIAFGGRNGTVVVHELRASKAQTLQAHQSAVTALSFSDDGKYLASYSAQDAKLSFWQTTQTFLGMGQSQMKCVRTHPAPAAFPVTASDGTLQPFKARLVWISGKSVTLMLPNGKENRFSL